MLDLLLNHLTVVTMDDDDRVLKNACIGVQPRSSAASCRSGSICCSFGMTFRMT